MQRRRTLLDRPEVPSIDWATAAVLAFASILADGIAIRLIGEGAARGTFSQRHTVFHDVQTGATFPPLQALPQARAAFETQDSPLTENSTVGFESGYNIQEPGRLVLWEAQYGDIINGAQVIIREGAELLHPGDGARRTLLARVTAHQIDSDLTVGHHAKQPVAPSPGGVLLAGLATLGRVCDP